MSYPSNNKGGGYGGRSQRGRSFGGKKKQSDVPHISQSKRVLVIPQGTNQKAANNLEDALHKEGYKASALTDVVTDEVEVRTNAPASVIEKYLDCKYCGATGVDPETGNVCPDCKGEKRFKAESL